MNITKMWFIHTMEYHSVLKKTEILSFTITWIYLEGIMRSETSQTQRDLLLAVAIKEKLVEPFQGEKGVP